MNKKSRFIVFLLSAIPGLSHFYLGQVYRGCLFLGAAIANIILVFGLSVLSWNRDFFLLLMGLPVIWFIALVDSMILTDRVINRMKGERGEGGDEYNGQACLEKEDGKEEMNVQNKKILTCLLSVVPGAGHMYLGYQRQGLELMTLFFFSFFFIDWLRISFFMFIIPVIWFYGMFDALGKVTGQHDEGGKDSISLLDFVQFNSPAWTSSKVLGYILIGVGLLLIFDRIISPLISHQIRNYLQTGIVAVLFIYGGIRILVGGRKVETCEKEVDESCTDGE